jgi:hypothetical protein
MNQKIWLLILFSQECFVKINYIAGKQLGGYILICPGHLSVVHKWWWEFE